MRSGRYAPRCLATRVAWPPVLVDDTIALKGGVDARYHSYLRQPLSSLARLAACIARKMGTIMARYVFGNEDKPGERWKRRLFRSR